MSSGNFNINATTENIISQISEEKEKTRCDGTVRYVKTFHNESFRWKRRFSNCTLYSRISRYILKYCLIKLKKAQVKWNIFHLKSQKTLSRPFFLFSLCCFSSMRVYWFASENTLESISEGKTGEIVCCCGEVCCSTWILYILFQNQTDVGQLFQRHKKPLNTQNHSEIYCESDKLYSSEWSFKCFDAYTEIYIILMNSFFYIVFSHLFLFWYIFSNCKQSNFR